WGPVRLRPATVASLPIPDDRTDRCQQARRLAITSDSAKLAAKCAASGCHPIAGMPLLTAGSTLHRGREPRGQCLLAAHLLKTYTSVDYAGGHPSMRVCSAVHARGALLPRLTEGRITTTKKDHMRAPVSDRRPR